VKTTSPQTTAAPSSPDGAADLSKLSLGQLADILGPLDARYSQAKSQRDKLQAEIQSRYTDHPAEAEFQAQGEKFIVTVGMKKNEREIPDILKLMRAIRRKLKLSATQFLKLCSIPLKEVDARLTPEEQEGFVTQERTGNRTIKVQVRPD
jgi:hypothetical protein